MELWVIENDCIYVEHRFKGQPVGPTLGWLGSKTGPDTGDLIVLFPTLTGYLRHELLQRTRYCVVDQLCTGVRFCPRSEWPRLLLTGQAIPIGMLLPKDLLTAKPNGVLYRSAYKTRQAVSTFMHIWNGAPEYTSIDINDITEVR